MAAHGYCIRIEFYTAQFSTWRPGDYESVPDLVQVRLGACLRTAYRMGLYRAWDNPPSSTMTSTALAGKLGADRTLIGKYNHHQEQSYKHSR